MPNLSHSNRSINLNSAGPPAPDYVWPRAFHVAAHATIGCGVGGWRDDLGPLVANETYQRAGDADDLRLLASSQWADVRRGALIRLAGDVGEHVATGNGRIGVSVVGGEIVWPDGWPRTTCAYYVTNAVTRIAGARSGQRVLEILRDTLKLVRANKTIIERVARELITYGEISAHQLRYMIGSAVVVPDDVVIGGGTYVD